MKDELPIQPSKPDRIPHDMAFALLLETACEQFQVLQGMLRRDLAVVRLNSRDANSPSHEFCDFRADACVRMALAKSFIANVIRAYRICEHGAQFLSAVTRHERNRFLKSTPAALLVRDVNEHGFDVAGNDGSLPSSHLHEDENARVDETSAIFLGPEKILMGPLNLFDVYKTVALMRDQAGFMSIRSKAS